MQRTDVVVVGSGPGGLAAAINLAGLGLRVTVVDKETVPGGRMRGISLGDGAYQLDTGPTIMQCPQLSRLFARAGKRLADYVKLQPVDPNTRLHFSGRHAARYFARRREDAARSRALRSGQTRGVSRVARRGKREVRARVREVHHGAG